MNESIGQRIAALRKAKNMTQSELSEELGISAQAVSKWENDLAYPDITLLQSLSEKLDCTIDHILNTDKTPEMIILPEEKRKKLKI